MTNRFMPKKPKFGSLSGHPYLMVITQNDFNEWFDADIKPMFENAIEVYGHEYGSMEFPQCKVVNPNKGSADTFKALLINITPVKETTAEDLLREIVSNVRGLTDQVVDIKIIEKAISFLAKNTK